jgi:hypothetical protein
VAKSGANQVCTKTLHYFTVLIYLYVICWKYIHNYS